MFEDQGIEQFSFVLDNAKCHKPKSVKDFMQKFCTMLYLPAYNPDFNPLENPWSEVERRLWEDATWTDMASFIVAINKQWKEVTSNKKCMAKLWNSMPKRLQRCIRLRGDMTKY